MKPVPAKMTKKQYLAVKHGKTVRTLLKNKRVQITFKAIANG